MCVFREGQTLGRYDVVCRQERVWTCPIHSDGPIVDYDDPEREIDFDFPIYGCTCDTTALWKGLGRWRLVLEPILSRILRELYLPPIMESLNNSVFYRALAREK